MKLPLQKIKKTQKKQFSFFTIFLRKFSVIIAYYLNQIGVVPHQVLFFRIFVFGGLSLFFFYSNNYLYNLIGLFFISLCYFFDLVDGDLARNYDKVTRVWGFLDWNFDALILNSIILTFTLKFLNNGDNPIFIIAGIMILFGTIFSSKMTELFRHRFNINCGQWSKIIEDYLKNNTLDKLSIFFYWLITPKWFILDLLSNFKQYLLIGIIFNIMPFTILGFAIAINLRWLILFVMAAFYYHGIAKENRKIQIFNLMKQSEIVSNF